MADLIDRRALFPNGIFFVNENDPLSSLDELIKRIWSTPTIDPESLRKKGAWIDDHCSVCGMMPMGEELWEHLDCCPPKMEYFMDFCPCCGAVMRQTEDTE